MQYRPGRESDFTHLETFVWQAIFPDFDVPGLTEEQRAENDAIVADSRQTVEAALERDDFLVISAWDERRRTLVGYLVLDASAGDFVVVVQLLVRRGDRGQGVGTKMLREAIDAADDRPIRIDVPAFAERAIAFFSRNGFDVTDDTPNEGPIPKRVLVHRPEPPTPPNSDIAFSFAFGEETAPASPPPAEACANCGSTLPPHANFCPHCGADQRAPLPEEPDGITNERIARDATPNADTPPDYAKLRSALEDLLGDRLTAYFGADALPRYLDRYRDDTEYHRIRDVSLRSLAEWLPHQLPDRKVDRRIGHDLGELVEYFIVESAADLHPGLFAQKLLRYQHPDWKTVDMFRLVMDYLNFREERETIYTDFAQAPARVIRHASQRYLGARQDERVFFICDQSWLGSGKQGFALTDAGIYWKPILQPAAAFAYVDLQPTQMNKGHLRINGHYFDAGSSLNRKLALLLDKLRRIDLGE